MRAPRSTCSILPLRLAAVEALVPGPVPVEERPLPVRQPVVRPTVILATWISCETTPSSSSFVRSSNNSPACWSLFCNSSVLATLSSHSSFRKIPTSSCNCWARTATMTPRCHLVLRLLV